MGFAWGTLNLLSVASSSLHLVCASRASALAMAQAKTVGALLARADIASEILTVTTTGDRDRRTPVHALGATNVFVKELELALRERRAAYAVHSCKDLPSSLAEDMRIAAIPRREDARDAFCSETYERFADLPAGARVGTSSPRRKSQLRALRPDLRYEDLRGNVDTRLRKLRDGTYDAIVVAMAGLNRLGAAATFVVPFSVEELVPCAGQGALAIEVRNDEANLLRMLREAANDAVAERCVGCERSALRALRAGCSAPVGVHAREHCGEMTVDVAYALGEDIVRERIDDRVGDLTEAEALGERLAANLAQRMQRTETARS
jgi:hydroxymethylbilane synthase